MAKYRHKVLGIFGEYECLVRGIEYNACASYGNYLILQSFAIKKPPFSLRKMTALFVFHSYFGRQVNGLPNLCTTIECPKALDTKGRTLLSVQWYDKNEILVS